MSGRASSVHGVKSSGSIIIVVVVSYRKSRTFSVDIYYYSAQSIYGSTIILSSLTSTILHISNNHCMMYFLSVRTVVHPLFM